MSSSSATHISAASFAYPSVDGHTRAMLAERLRATVADGSTFVLNTCLRTEVFVAGDNEDLLRTLELAFDGTADAGLAKIRHDSDAVEHLYRVAAGLESPIRGEGEILTQFRQTLAKATESGYVAGLFSKLVATGVAVGRQARELLPESPHDSMAAVAAQTVGGADRVAVLGSGAMATAIINALRGLPAPPMITVVARRPERVTAHGVAVWPFERALEALGEFPAVVSATSAKKRLIESDVMAETVAQRSNPLTLVDMAMPPDFDATSSETLRYIDIDDLARMADRRPRSDDADELVRQAAGAAHRMYVEHHQVAPVIGGLTRQADEIVETLVARFGSRLTNEDDIAVLRQTAHTVARTLLAGPIAYIKQPDRAPEAVEVVADAFGVDE
jgi:glutamyl-tRNA reductase